MKEKLRELLMTKYPAWHDKPLRLSVAEMEDPYSVLEFFFECYSLPNIRACLGEMLNDSLHADCNGARDHLGTHADIEKLVEAVWIIYNQAGEEEETENIEEATTQSEDAAENEENELSASCTQTIHNFFNYYPLPDARSYLVSAFKAAESKSIWQKRSPADLMHFFETLENLLPAVFTIVKNGFIHKKVLLPKSSGTPDLTKHKLYCGIYDQNEPWDYFPRSLGVKEYNNPYKALQKFTALATKKQCKETLHYILEFALSENNLSELGIDMELTRTLELLQKMLDACHLIDVRTAEKKQ